MRAQDGRSSEAMFQLIERVRQLRRDGKPIGIIAIDETHGHLKRDASMALNVRNAMRDKPQAHIIVLVGNVHAFKDLGAHSNKNYESMAYLLAELQPLTLNVMAKRGAFWGCIDNCGPNKVPELPQKDAIAPGVHVGLSPFPPPAHHGTIMLNRVQASPPARSQ